VKTSWGGGTDWEGTKRGTHFPNCCNGKIRGRRETRGGEDDFRVAFSRGVFSGDWKEVRVGRTKGEGKAKEGKKKEKRTSRGEGSGKVLSMQNGPSSFREKSITACTKGNAAPSRKKKENSKEQLGR